MKFSSFSCSRAVRMPTQLRWLHCVQTSIIGELRSISKTNDSLSADVVQMSIHGPSSVRAGRLLVLTCTLVEGNDVTISWFKDGKVMKSDDKTTILSSEGMSTLKVSRASTHDSGSYSCLGNNRIAEERVIKHVTVEGDYTRKYSLRPLSEIDVMNLAAAFLVHAPRGSLRSLTRYRVVMHYM